MAAKTTKSVLDDARATLATARLGLADLASVQPERRLPGLRNVIVFGRSVTLVLQNLRATEAGFEDWYAPHVEVMRADPLMRYMVEMRNEILKQGSLPTSVGSYIGHLNVAELMARMPEPPGATSFFIGDQTGGSGWEVALSNGETEKFYVDLPGDIGYVYTLRLPEAPTSHLGAAITDRSVEHLSALYLTYLADLVRHATQTFLPAP